MSKDKKPGSYEVGYGKPPREHQFQKGQSGNPSGSRGRKQGPSSFTGAMKATLLKKQTVIIDGKRRRMTRFEIMLEGLSGSAMQGDEGARKEVIRMASQIDKFEKQYPEERGKKSVVVTLNIGDDETNQRVEQRIVEERVRKRLEAERSAYPMGEGG